MKQSVTFSAFVDAFRAHDRYDSFGYAGLLGQCVDGVIFQCF